jgi:hypothetical protein
MTECVTVAGIIPLSDALWLGFAGMVGMGLFAFGLGAWWRGGK